MNAAARGGIGVGLDGWLERATAGFARELRRCHDATVIKHRRPAVVAPR